VIGNTFSQQYEQFLEETAYRESLAAADRVSDEQGGQLFMAHESSITDADAPVALAVDFQTHMSETAYACGLSLRIAKKWEESFKMVMHFSDLRSFEMSNEYPPQTLERWGEGVLKTLREHAETCENRAKAVGKRIAKKAGKEAAKGLAENIMNPDEAAIGVDEISCLEPEMDGEDMYCPESMVATLDMALDDLVCCAPHDADKLTVSLLSDLMVYEDQLPEMPATEKAVGAWWGLLVAGAKKLCTKATAKAVGKHIVKKGKEHVIDSAKDAAWDAAAGAVEDWINPDEAAREVASVSAVNNSITYPLALIGFVTLLYGAYAMGTSGKYEVIPEAEEI